MRATPFLYQGFRLGLRNPSLRPWILLGILAYLLSPIDLIPSVLPIVGEMDDLVLLGLLLTELAQMALGDPFRPQPQPKSATRTEPTSNQTIDIQATSLDGDP
ncbi:MAG: YkvA family protein [Cyanobacteriota bacterium]